MIEFKMEKRALFLGNQPVDLPLPVLEMVRVPGGVAVRVDAPAGQNFNRNVFFVDKSGTVKWQIEESPHGLEHDNPFMSLWISKEGNLVAGSWNGVDYCVNLASGEIHVQSFGR